MHSRISILGMNLPAYSMMALIGISIVTFIGIIIVWNRKLYMEFFLKLECIGGTSAIIGAKLWDMIVASIETGEHNISLSAFMDSGLSFYGGLALGLLGVFITSLVLHVDFNSYAKNLIFLVPLLHGIWKIGCFMGGCCYGILYDGVCAVIFPEGVKAPAGISLFPIQILEAGISFIMAITFYGKGRKDCWKHPVLEYMGCYSIIRFIVEFFRYHDFQYKISIAQVTSIVCLTCILIYLIAYRIMLSDKRSL